jgi:hypothetical protein
METVNLQNCFGERVAPSFPLARLPSSRALDRDNTFRTPDIITPSRGQLRARGAGALNPRTKGHSRNVEAILPHQAGNAADTR